MTRHGRSADRDRGVATVWAAAAVAVLIGVSVAVLDLGSAVTARHRAESAADLAALAAAGQAVHGSAVACARAEDAAGGTGGRIVLCRLSGGDALVEVEVSVRLATLGAVTVRGRARAGPAESDRTAGGAGRSPEERRGPGHAERSASTAERTQTEAMHD